MEISLTYKKECKTAEEAESFIAENDETGLAIKISGAMGNDESWDEDVDENVIKIRFFTSPEFKEKFEQWAKLNGFKLIDEYKSNDVDYCSNLDD